MTIEKKSHTIRRATKEDLDAIYEIELQCSNLWKHQYFEAELQNDFSLTIVACHDEKVVAFAVAWNIPGEIQLNNIGVLPSLRRSGLATALMDYIVLQWGDKAPERILIEVKSSNTGAISFYRSLGFHQTGVREKYYSGEDAILMEKDLQEKESQE